MTLQTRSGEARRRIVLTASATGLVVACTIVGQQRVHALHGAPRLVPANIQVPVGNREFLEAHGVGTQNYLCLPAGSAFAWTFVGPQATLFNHRDLQDITHFLSPNAAEAGQARATWQHSRDTSAVWAQPIQSSSDPAFVAASAIPWLLLQEVGAAEGSSGGRELTDTTYVQRLNTSGGVAPATGCVEAADVGRRAFVPYEADYVFYKNRERRTSPKRHLN